MSMFWASYKIELSKLSAKKKYIVFSVIGVLICLIRVSMLWLVGIVSKGQIVMKMPNLALEMLPFFAEIFVPLMIFMAVGDLFSSEMQENTLKAMLTRPVTRLKLMISKSLACFTVGAGIFMLIVVSCTIFEVVFGNGAKLSGYAAMNFGAYIVDMIPMFVLVLMAVLINIVCKTPTLAMFLCFLTYAVMKYCNYFVPSINNLLFTSFNQWHKLWIGSTLPIQAIVPKIMLIVGSAILFATVGYYLFDRKDV